ncbi:Transcriptional regulatory protein ZraR [uncultured Eubacterium sp.]|nr:Transcriptional regulatory protein ZraR [uncultured Eubacterium sp.]
MEKIRITKEELQRPGPFLKGIMELAFDESCIMDKNGYILHCSDSSPLIWNRPNEESIGMHISELDSASPYPQLLETGEAVLGKIHIINGMSCITHMIPLFDYKDEIIGAFGVIIFRGTEKIKKLMRDNSFDFDSKSKDLYNQLAKAESYYTLADFIGNSPAVQDMIIFAKKVAVKNYPVLIRGETGCGKEIISNGIHAESHLKAKAPFIKINCTAIPSNLLESELFGYEKGAFSGAYSTKLGKFEVAGTGTILLDEIGSLDSALQSKLLRVLEEKEFERVGGNTLIPLRARIIACTNSSLEKKMQEGEFREDLYYRLSIAEIIIPPLRARREDIPLLINHFITKDALDLRCTPDAMELLQEYNWPGNVRQLRNFVAKMDLLERKVITEKDVRQTLNINDSHERESIRESASIDRKVSSYEKKLIEDALLQNDLNISRTAKALNISRNTLYARIRRLNIHLEKRIDQ